jgi:hypothetical protein
MRRIRMYVDAVLRVSLQVRSLVLNCNAYRDAGLVAIARLMRVNRTITELDVSGSRSGGTYIFG